MWKVSDSNFLEILFKAHASFLTKCREQYTKRVFKMGHRKLYNKTGWQRPSLLALFVHAKDIRIVDLMNQRNMHVNVYKFGYLTNELMNNVFKAFEDMRSCFFKLQTKHPHSLTFGIYICSHTHLQRHICTHTLIHTQFYTYNTT